jgi:pimeloyl-ACP methyl ester carboxylesterase
MCDVRLFEAQVEDFDATVIGEFYGRADGISAMADHAIELMPERCALLGHSMGARVAVEIWRKAPERVERLALADTGMHPVRAGERESRMALLDLGERSGIDALVDAWLPPMLAPANVRDPALLDRLRRMCVDAGIAAYARQIEALLNRPDALSVLPTIDCPTLVIAGEEDAWSPVSQHEAIAAAIPGSRLRTIPEAGHMAPAERPDAFNRQIRDWLSWANDHAQPAVHERIDG